MVSWYIELSDAGGIPKSPIGDNPCPTAHQTDSGRIGPWTRKAPQWASVHDMAMQADLKDLTYAMAVYLNRIDEVLS